ncbi:MAG: VCBS repeat-containing protein [Ruminococcaceae bacterium]|nr:VCBS repeat-containing protein [Oscillospiraceae bacterium]
MKCVRKRARLLGAALLAAYLLSGCTGPTSVESLFTLPKLPIEYTDLSGQISDLIADGYEYASPTSGRNIQSVQMVDLDGDGDEEAVAFFRRTSDEKPLKIFVFRANDDTYDLLCTLESSGTGVDSVYYQDLTGDGELELVVGWRISSDVQTVAAYDIGPEPTVLMQSGYVRYSVEELDGDGVPSLLIFRPDEDGNSVAEFYSWHNDSMSVSYTANLSCTMAELARGSAVSGRLNDRRSAVFVTGITDEGTAVTDILTYRDGAGLVNVTTDQQTGSSTAAFPYMQLRPQDISGNGVLEIPSPRLDRDGQPTGIVDWLRYDAQGQPTRIMTTYHDLSGGWYLILPETLTDRVTVASAESRTNELQTTISTGGQPAVVIYTLTGENRENRALWGNRLVLKRQTGTIYAAELLEGAAAPGLTEDVLRQSFKLIVNQWTNG